MNVEEFYHQGTGTYTYLVTNEKESSCIIIDPVLDFDLGTGEVTTSSAQEIKSIMEKKGLTLKAIIETHAHADHLSSSMVLKDWYPDAVLAIGEGITKVQEVFVPVFHLDIPHDGSQFDKLLKDGEEWEVAGLKLKCYSTPGHTPACSSYLIENHLFTGDTLFMPDFGSGRCDFPAGSASDLYHSVTQKLFSLPEQTIVHVGHDYGTDSREPQAQTTIGESKEKNKHLKAGTSLEEFTSFRENRDAQLKPPTLLYPSIQVNIDGGKIPNDFLRWPIKRI